MKKQPTTHLTRKSDNGRLRKHRPGDASAIIPVLPYTPDQVKIISADENGKDVASAWNLAIAPHALTKENYLALLEPGLNRGDFLLNLSVDVSSLALIELCRRRGALYLDTCIEPWPGGYTDTSLSPSLRSNYALRENALSFGRENGKGPTALVAHGANPGLASAFVKQALLNIACRRGIIMAKPATALIGPSLRTTRGYGQSMSRSGIARP